MMITTSTLTKAAAVAAMAGGLLFIAVQIKHPLLDSPFTTTTEYAVRETTKIFMAVFSLIGITGIYLRQVQKIGLLGLIGYVVLGVGYLTILSVQVIGVFVLPDLAGSQPGYVNDVLAVATSGTPVGDVSRMQTLSHIGAAYIVGGVVFGIAIFRAGILARWAAVLMSVGAVATVATFRLPELTQRLFALPVGVALIGLGYSLWRDQRTARPVPYGYQLRVDGHLDQHWASWFGLTLTHEDDGTTCLTGAITDQAQLHGLLARIRDLGVTLISVEAVDVTTPQRAGQATRLVRSGHVRGRLHPPDRLDPQGRPRGR